MGKPSRIIAWKRVEEEIPLQPESRWSPLGACFIFSITVEVYRSFQGKLKDPYSDIFSHYFSKSS